MKCARYSCFVSRPDDRPLTGRPRHYKPTVSRRRDFLRGGTGLDWQNMPSQVALFDSNSRRRIDMPTRNVVLTEQQADLVAALVGSGRYQNASEVLRDGLRLLQRREDEEQAKLEALRGALDEAEAAVAAGDLSDYSPALLEEIAGQESKVTR